MFYLWTLFAVLLLFSVYGQTYIAFHGFIPNISSLAITIALLIAVSGMAYRKYHEYHKGSKIIQNLGYCLIIIAFFIIINRSNYSSFENFIRGLEFASLAVIPGILLVMYNWKSEIKNTVSEEQLQEVHYDLFEVVFLFEQISEFPRIRIRLKETIENCVSYLIAIEQNEYLINQELIRLFIKLLDNYIELNTLTVQTSRTNDILERIDLLFPNIEKALEQAYNNSIHSKITEAEINLKVLETYLKSHNGLEDELRQINN